MTDRAALAEAAASSILKLDRAQWSALAELALKTQRADGLWSNSVNLMKEDDPLIASPFAMQSLLHARTALGKR